MKCTYKFFYSHPENEIQAHLELPNTAVNGCAGHIKTYRAQQVERNEALYLKSRVAVLRSSGKQADRTPLSIGQDEFQKNDRCSADLHLPGLRCRPK